MSRAAEQRNRELTGIEAIWWELPSRAEARNSIQNFLFRLRDAGVMPYTFDAQTLQGSFESRDNSIRGLMSSVSPDGRRWFWFACRT